MLCWVVGLLRGSRGERLFALKEKLEANSSLLASFLLGKRTAEAAGNAEKRGLQVLQIVNLI